MTGNPIISVYIQRCQKANTADITNLAEEPLNWKMGQPADSVCCLEKTQVCMRAAGKSPVLFWGGKENKTAILKHITDTNSAEVNVNASCLFA